ncbi:hypothetical protein ES288_A07G114800v1, partial [Gossypium darwinii]
RFQQGLSFPSPTSHLMIAVFQKETFNFLYYLFHQNVSIFLSSIWMPWSIDLQFLMNGFRDPSHQPIADLED